MINKLEYIKDYCDLANQNTGVKSNHEYKTK